MIVRVGLIQLRVEEGQVEHNRNRAAELLREAAGRGAKLAILPELWPSGFAMEQLSALAEDSRGPSLSLLKKLARELSMTIVGGSMIERRQGKLFNTCFVVDDSGQVVGKYRKVHLYPYGLGESRYFSPGGDWSSFSLHQPQGEIQVGLGLCFDVTFPEFFRNLALRGARMLTLPAAWELCAIEDLHRFCRVRAMENRCYLALANCAGGTANNYGGQSLLIDPRGRLLLQAGEDEGAYLADLDDSVFELPQFYRSIDLRRPFLDEIDNNLL